VESAQQESEQQHRKTDHDLKADWKGCYEIQSNLVIRHEGDWIFCVVINECCHNQGI
jgi:mRNA-degrading endonuclease YafQ of YafQ-DinJ toxin-antitoxin module